jgi:lysyl endopeptidase
MRKTVCLTFATALFIALTIPVIAQISQGGTPLSFDKVPYTFSKHVPVQIMPAVDVNALRAEDLILDQQKDIPWRFGQNIDVDIDLKTLGVSETIPGMGTLWRIDIVSPGALSINLLFDNFQIPPGATLFIYNQDRNDIIGAFTEFNNREDRIFATTLVRGEHITLEYFEPKHTAFAGELHISRVTHGYRGPEEFMKAFGSSGLCNVNVACPASAGMENQIKSSCMLVSGGSGFCSGALINNTANNGIPYVLSADHCYSNPPDQLSTGLTGKVPPVLIQAVLHLTIQSAGQHREPEMQLLISGWLN